MRTNREALTLLTPPRFLAALAVLMLHAWSSSGLGPMPGFIRAGYLGVPFFFVLSGFILMHAHKGEQTFPEAKQFWWRRFARIYPAYALGLLLTLFIFVRAMHAQGSSPIHTAGVAALWVTLLHDWSPSTYLVWNGPGWTLGCEAFFYALFPLVALWISRLSRSQASLLLGALWLISMARFIPNHLDGWWLTKSPIARFPEFLIGIAAYVVYRDTAASTRKATRAWVGVVCAVFIVLAFALHDQVSPGTFDCGTLAPMYAGLLVALASYGSPSVPRVATELGEASYDLYILQAGVMALTLWAAGKAHLAVRGPLGFTALLLVVVLASLLSHRWFSTPARRWIATRIRPLENLRPSPGVRVPVESDA